MVMPDKLDDRIRLVEEHVQAENAHDLDRIMTTFGEQAHYEDQPWDEHHQDPGGVREYYMRLFTALPDLHIAIERWHVTHDDVIIEVTITEHITGSGVVCRRPADACGFRSAPFTRLMKRASWPESAYIMIGLRS